MPKSMGPFHMAGTDEYEVQRDNHFEISINDPNIDITLAVDSTNLPSISNDPIELFYGNAPVKVAGEVSYDDVTVEVKDFIGKDIEKTVEDWQHQVYDPETGALGKASVYKKEGELLEYGPDGNNERIWILEGVWPTSVEYGDFSYDGSDKKLISITLSVDRARRK